MSSDEVKSGNALIIAGAIIVAGGLIAAGIASLNTPNPGILIFPLAGGIVGGSLMRMGRRPTQNQSSDTHRKD